MNRKKIKMNLILNYSIIIGFALIAVIQVNSQICGPESPGMASDCFQYSRSGDTCCYASVASQNKSNSATLSSATLCVLIPLNQTFITPYITELNLGANNDNLKVAIDCGPDTSANRAFGTCGPTSPTSSQQCFLFSTANYTCCYFASPDGTSTCILNNKLTNSSQTIFGITITCAGDYTFPPFILLMLIFYTQLILF